MHTLTWELQEVRFVAEDQVVVGDEVEEPHIQLLCVVALTIKTDMKLVRINAFHQITWKICCGWRPEATASTEKQIAFDTRQDFHFA